MSVIKIGTRNSKLAMWQAEWVKTQLESDGLNCQLIPIETIGDRKLNSTIAKIGSKGVFTEELEQMLSSGHVDIAVHSAKDLSSQLPEGFKLIAFGPRAAVEDVLVSTKEIDVKSNLKIGTASTRRIAQLSKYYPQFNTITVRGNLQTRIEKHKKGACDALLLAKAGVDRMGYTGLIKHTFNLDELTPAAGQGSIAIECHDTLSNDFQEKIRRAVNNPETEKLILTERAFLRKMDGGCSVPVYALATHQKNQISVVGGVLNIDGNKELRETLIGDNPEELGISLAEIIISKGGQDILKEVREALNN